MKNNDMVLVLEAFDDGRALIDVAYGARRARLELDLVERLDQTQSNAQASQLELVRLVRALSDWIKNPENEIADGQERSPS
jgi:hypothetical protein